VSSLAAERRPALATDWLSLLFALGSVDFAFGQPLIKKVQLSVAATFCSAVATTNLPVRRFIPRVFDLTQIIAFVLARLSSACSSRNAGCGRGQLGDLRNTWRSCVADRVACATRVDAHN